MIRPRRLRNAGGALHPACATIARRVHDQRSNYWSGRSSPNLGFRQGSTAKIRAGPTQKRVEGEKMVQKLQEKCREARDRLGYTNQDIADATGIPLSSVKNFFAATSKVPGLVYAGMICKFLGVSIDECLGITPAEDAEARLRRQLKEDHMNSENQRLTEVNGLRKELDKSRLSTILVLAFLCAVLSVTLIFYIVVDWHIKDAGLIKGGEIGVGAWIIIALVAIAFGVMTSALFSAIRYARRIAPEEQGRGEV